MRHFILIGLLFCFFHPSTNGQPNNLPKDGPDFYSYSFQNHFATNADSALFFIRKLASDPKYAYLLETLLHNSFAQTFRKMWEKETTDTVQKARVEKAHQILNGIITDSNQALVNAAKPLFFWVQMQLELRN